MRKLIFIIILFGMMLIPVNAANFTYIDFFPPGTFNVSGNPQVRVGVTEDECTAFCPTVNSVKDPAPHGNGVWQDCSNAANNSYDGWLSCNGNGVEYGLYPPPAGRPENFADDFSHSLSMCRCEANALNGFESWWYVKKYFRADMSIPVTEVTCDFEISPYPANPGTLLTLTDISTGGEPTGYGWGYQIPGGSWDNTSLGIGETAAYTLAYFGQYNFSHEVGNSAGTDTCWYPYWSGTNYTAFNVTPTLVGNLTTNITSQNISGQFAPLNLTLIDKPFFKNQLDNMTYFGNYSSAWTGFIDNMTESVNVTFNEVEARINPFNFLTDLIMNSHNLFVIIFIPLLGYVSFPLVITSAVINIIPESIQLLISLGLLVDLFFLVLRGPD